MTSTTSLTIPRTRFGGIKLKLDAHPSFADDSAQIAEAFR